MKPISRTLVLCCILSLANDLDGARILAIFPLNGYSHFLLARTVLRSLADKGHQVDVVSHFPSEKSFPNYTDIIDLSGTSRVMRNNLTLKFVRNEIGTLFLRPLVKMSGSDVCELLGLPELQNLVNNPPSDAAYDLVITELFFAHCYFAFGRHLKVPVVAIAAPPILPHFNAILGNPFNTAYVKEYPDGSMKYMNFWQRFKNTLVASFVTGQIEYYTRDQTALVRKYFGSEMPEIGTLSRDVALVLINSHHTLFGVRPLTPVIVEVGGLHVTDDQSNLSSDVEQWLDGSSDGFVYVSFGSMIKIESFPEETLLELYSAFVKLKPLRFLVKIANPEELPPGLPDNVKILSWIPQIAVLKHENIRVFVSHGGLNGILEAVTYAVPIIGVPVCADQPLNVHNLVEKGVAVSLDYNDLTKEKFIAAVVTITNDSSYQTAMDKLSEQFLDRPLSAKDAAVYWVEYILRHGAEALKSPATKLTWWQLALLDVYSFMILIMFSVVYLIKFFLTAKYRRISNRPLSSSKTTKTN